MKKTIKVAVTGGIGSGKSAVLGIFHTLNIPTVSCDDVVKELYNKNYFRRKIKKNFPLSAKGRFRVRIDKKVLSNIVFEDKKELERLNNLTHPEIMKRILRFFDKTDSPMAIAEVPLLFEGGYEEIFDYVFVVVRDKEKRIESVINRSKLSRKEVEERMNSQIDYESLDKSNFFVLENNGDLDELKCQLINAVQKIQNNIN